jgi:hypothetical protein
VDLFPAAPCFQVPLEFLVRRLSPLAVLGDIGRRSGRVLRHFQSAPSTRGDGANGARSACSRYYRTVRLISSPGGLRVLGALALLRQWGGRLPRVSQSSAASRHMCGCPMADGGRHEDEARRHTPMHASLIRPRPRFRSFHSALPACCFCPVCRPPSSCSLARIPSPSSLLRLSLVA